MSSKKGFYLDQLSPCSHEEADTRILLHAKNVLLTGHKTICIETVNTDVIVIAIGILANLKNLGLNYIWFDFGVGKNRKQIHLNELVKELPLKTCAALPFFPMLSRDPTRFHPFIESVK